MFNNLNRGKCRYCGMDIVWIKMKSGKKMPCNPKMIGYRIPKVGKGKESIVTTGGEVISADRVYDDNADGLGYISHFATCEEYKKGNDSRQG